MTDPALIATGQRQNHYPARSKMLDMYVGDIARMLADGRSEGAEQAALAVPHIAVALAHADLQSSPGAYQTWCMRWVRPELDASVYENWWSRSADREHDGGVPFAALRGLGLRRRAREVPLPLLPPELTGPPTPESITGALLRAERNWYEQEGRYQATVQSNLARLGVLR